MRKEDRFADVSPAHTARVRVPHNGFVKVFERGRFVRIPR